MLSIPISVIIDRANRQVALYNLNKDDMHIVLGKFEKIEMPQSYIMEDSKLMKLCGYNIEYGNFDYGFYIK